MTSRVTVSERDLRALLSAVSGDRGDPPANGLPWSMLADLTGLVGCDLVSFAGLDSSRQVTWFAQGVWAGDDEGEDSVDEHDRIFWTQYWHCVTCSYPDLSGDLRSVTKVSDFYSDRQWHNTAMYIDYFGSGAEHEIMVALPAGPGPGGRPGRTLRLVFHRGTGPDFSERDRALLALLRPHLQQACLDAERRRRGVPQLTRRQWELLRLVADGYTNAQIARRLGVSEGTVGTHLEHIYTRLQVSSRTAAVTRAFPLTQPSDPTTSELDRHQPGSRPRPARPLPPSFAETTVSS
jgi:DNA-binding CsgD family transcriptional regulator